MKKIEGIVITCISTVLSIDEETIKPDSLIIEDLGATSLDSIELQLEIEDCFSQTLFNEEATTKIYTVRDLLEFVKAQVKSNKKAWQNYLKSRHDPNMSGIAARSIGYSDMYYSLTVGNLS